MSTIREKIMGLDPHEPTFYYCGYSDGLKKAADMAEAEVARLEATIDFLAKDVSSLTEEKDRLEVLLAESGKVNFHLASWQCQFTDGKKGLVNADNGDQYCAMEREVQRLEARVRELEEALKLAADALEIANDWNLHDVQIDPPKEWGLYAEQEDSADGWCSTQALSNKLRELAERVIGGE